MYNNCSVVVPVYNKKKYLESTLKSLLEQEFNGVYEIVVVDDGSTDGSTDNILNIDSRIRLVRQENRGAAVARHVGVLNSKYDIVVFQDADDLALPNKLSLLVGELVSNKNCVASFGLVKTDKVGEVPASQVLHMPCAGRVLCIHDPFSIMLKNLGPLALSMNLATWKRFALEASASREFYKAANDYDFQLRVARHGSFLFINEITNLYSTDSGGITSLYGSWRQLYYAAAAAHDAFSALKEREPYKDYIREGFMTYVPRTLTNLIIAGDYWLFLRSIKIALNYLGFSDLLRGMWWEFDEFGGKSFFLIKSIRFFRGLVKRSH